MSNFLEGNVNNKTDCCDLINFCAKNNFGRVLNMALTGDLCPHRKRKKFHRFLPVFVISYLARDRAVLSFSFIVNLIPNPFLLVEVGEILSYQRFNFGISNQVSII